MLRVYVSSDADLFFLYVLEVNEDDFAALKLDQGILVGAAAGGATRDGRLQLCQHRLCLPAEAPARLMSVGVLQVDFANFPGKIIGLLEKCLACRGEELPRCARCSKSSSRLEK